MKPISLLISASLATLVVAIAHAHPLFDDPVRVPLSVDQVYAPLGFDSNDNVQLVIDGFLPTLCHKSVDVAWTLNEDTISIQVTALLGGPRKGETSCPRQRVPFMESVSLGVLKPGHYKVRVNNGDDPELKTPLISVAQTHSQAIDDHIYANVTRVDRVEDEWKVVLSGYNPSPCYALDQVKIISNDVDTVSILPILKQTSQYCPEKRTPFAYEVEIPTNLPAADVLLHVRVMNGKSVNALFENFADNPLQ